VTPDRPNVSLAARRNDAPPTGFSSVPRRVVERHAIGVSPVGHYRFDPSGAAGAGPQRAPPDKLRIVLGEDSYLASEGIAGAIARIEGIELVGVSGHLHSLMALIDEERPDAVLTDIRMPPTNTDEGIRLANELRTSAPGVGVVVLSQHNEPAYAGALFAAGSEGRAYLLKERVKDAEELGRALRTVAAGGSVVDSDVVAALLKAHRIRDESQLSRLTRRELEILGLIAEGRSNAAIADALVLTKRAVERHINGIFMKLELGDSQNVSRRVKAVLIYLAEEGG
jgi:DNA-binding NarL/FixJ family response regulator